MNELIELIKYAWVPVMIFIHKENKEKHNEHRDQIKDLSKKVSSQMTKTDVIEVVDNAVKLLTVEIKADLRNLSHNIKTIESKEDAVLLELLTQMKKLNNDR